MNDHNWTEQHLAWYLNGTLVGEEYARAHRHLKDCLVCQQELSAHQRLAEAVSKQSEVSSNSAAALSVLSDQLTENNKPRFQWRRRLSSLFGRTPASIRGLLTLQTALLVFASVFLLHSRTADERTLHVNENQYRTLSSTTPVSGDIRVIFAPKTTVSGMQELLAAINATIIDGPGERGVITLTIDDPMSDEVLQILRGSPYIQLAEPLSREAVTSK